MNLQKCAGYGRYGRGFYGGVGVEVGHSCVGFEDVWGDWLLVCRLSRRYVEAFLSSFKRSYLGVVQ